MILIGIADNPIFHSIDQATFFQCCFMENTEILR